METANAAVWEHGSACFPGCEERYQNLRFIGQGGMGAVYKAEDTLLGRTVALKILHPALARDERCLRALRREARNASAIGHPGVVRAFDAGTYRGAPMFSMTLVEGESLAARLKRRGPLAAGEARELLRQLAEALDAIHSAGIVHRDLKPQNLLLDAQGGIHISDFGLSASLGGDTALDLDSDCSGTPRYMSPEQLQGLPASPRSDLFSLGVVLHEMLTGAAPDLDCADLDAPLPRERKSGAAYTPPPGPLRHILARCLRMNPADRYATARELLADLTPPPRALPAIAIRTARRCPARPCKRSHG